MTTKEQERAALAKIRKIVEGLGEESYIGRAFEGCFEIAQDNIDNDFWNSQKASIEELNKKLDKAAEDREYFRAEAERQSEFTERAEKERDEALHKLNDSREDLKKSKEAHTKCWNQLVKEQTRVEGLEDEIVHLKAKLYDLMVADRK